jgi:hypothetical protein
MEYSMINRCPMSFYLLDEITGIWYTCKQNTRAQMQTWTLILKKVKANVHGLEQKQYIHLHYVSVVKVSRAHAAVM